MCNSEELLRARDRDLWLGASVAPRDARPHIHALYAFAQEMADVSGKVHATAARRNAAAVVGRRAGGRRRARRGGVARQSPGRCADRHDRAILLPRDEFVALGAQAQYL